VKKISVLSQGVLQKSAV